LCIYGKVFAANNLKVPSKSPNGFVAILNSLVRPAANNIIILSSMANTKLIKDKQHLSSCSRRHIPNANSALEEIDQTPAPRYALLPLPPPF
jgi:hypothetical protein